MSIRFALCIIVIVTIIAFIGIAYMQPGDEKKSANAEKFYQRSNGTLDNNAKLALKTIKSIKKPNANDNFIAGNIIEHNTVPGQENEQPGEQRIIESTRRYRDAVDEIARGNYRGANPQFMLDHIIDFGGNNLPAYQRGGAAPIAFDLPVDIIDDGILVELYDLTRTADTVRNNHIIANADAAKRISTNKKEFSDNFTTLATTHTNDPQNVHDSGVRVGNQNTLNRIRSGGDNLYQVFTEIRAYIDASDTTEEKKKNAKITLDTMSEGAYIMAHNDTEDRIVKYVWDRSKEPANAANADNIRDAVVVALHQSVTPGSKTPVCINGRVSNILGSLVTLDHDDSVGAAVTEEQYKNDIYSNASKILENELAKAADSNDPGQRQVADSYYDGNETDNVAMELFKQNVRNSIDVMIDSYKGRINDNRLSTLRTDCYIGASVD